MNTSDDGSMFLMPSTELNAIKNNCFIILRCFFSNWFQTLHKSPFSSLDGTKKDKFWVFSSFAKNSSNIFDHFKVHEDISFQILNFWKNNLTRKYDLEWNQTKTPKLFLILTVPAGYQTKIPVCGGAAHHLVLKLGFNITDQLLHHQNTKSRVFSHLYISIFTGLAGYHVDETSWSWLLSDVEQERVGGTECNIFTGI